MQAGEPEVFAAMRQALASYTGNPERGQLTQEDTRTMEPLTVERLRAMGYVE